MFSLQRCQRMLLFFLISGIIFTPGAPPAAGAGQHDLPLGENLAVVLVVDVSGSMRRTDPGRLRETAAHVFIELLSPGDHLGIVIFDHEAALVVPLQPLEGAANRERIKDTLSPLLEPRGDTDFQVALELAFSQFQQHDLAGRRPAVVLLTDGEPDPAPGWAEDPARVAAYMDSLWQLANRFALQEIPVFSVGFSDEIDPEFMARLALASRGDYEIHSEPTGLVLSFFELLGRLKNRRVLLRETFTLQEATRTFPFQVDELTRQVNLVAVNLAGERVKLELEPPPGAHAAEEKLRLDSWPAYSLAVLSQPAAAHWGSWSATVGGSGPIQFMADTDLHIKAWLEAPTPGSQHPLHEPLHFIVRLSGAAALGQAPIQLELRLEKPQGEAVTIPLTEAGGYFQGQHPGLDRAGDYVLQVRLLLAGELLSTFDSRLHIRDLPALVSDFWGGQDLRLGEEVLLTASLQTRGRRLQEGRELQLELIRFEFINADGNKITVPLYDSGKPEHGDIRAGDGIFANRFTFTDAGTFRPLLLAAGRYGDGAFILDKSPAPFQVHAPGEVLLSMSRSELRSTPGSVLSLPLQLQNRSPFSETIYIEQPQQLGLLSATTLTLEAGESKSVNLTLQLRHDLEKKEHALLLHFRPAYPLTRLAASPLHMQLAIMSPLQLFVQNSFKLLLTAAAVAAALLLLACLFYGGGLLLYRIIIHPRTRVGGKLTVVQAGAPQGKEGPSRTLRLWKIKKSRVVISFDPENKDAHFYLAGSEFSHDLIIQALWYNRYPPFMQGWKGLLERHIPIRTSIKCTPPGIMEQEGHCFTEKELFHSSVFASGPFIFHYENPYGKWYKEKGDGIDLLEGKV